MIVLPDRTVMLNEGEVIPVWCGCGNIYQPKAQTRFSKCPQCKNTNWHCKQEAAPVEPEGEG